MMSKTIEAFRRPQAAELARRLAEPRRFLQVVAGAAPGRQDDARAAGRWQRRRSCQRATRQRRRTDAARAGAGSASSGSARGWLAGRRRRAPCWSLDEVQKIPGWSETVKRLWDEDTRATCPLKVVLLGSAPLLVQRGLTESLAGRFEVLHLPHWSFAEMRAAFGLTLEQYLFFGGYPGAAPAGRRAARAGGATSSTRSSRRRSRATCCCSRGWTSRRCCGGSSSWAAATRARCSRTRRCSASCRTPATRRRWRTTSTCWPAPAC